MVAAAAISSPLYGHVAPATDTSQALPYLEALEAEHAFWMNERPERLATRVRQAYRASSGAAGGRTAAHATGDDSPSPGLERTVRTTRSADLPEARRESFIAIVKATAESGWTSRSRW